MNKVSEISDNATLTIDKRSGVVTQIQVQDTANGSGIYDADISITIDGGGAKVISVDDFAYGDTATDEAGMDGNILSRTAGISGVLILKDPILFSTSITVSVASADKYHIFYDLDII